MAANPGNIGVRGVHINQPLSQLSIAYRPTGYISEQIFPVIPVKHESDNIIIWDKGQRFRVDRTDGQGSKRADGTRAVNSNFGFTQISYTAEEYAREVQITDRQRANADDVLALEASLVQAEQDLLMLDQELRVAKLLTTAANYAAGNTITLSGTGQWNNASFASQAGTQSVIESNIDAGREAVRLATGGKEANTLILPRAVARVVKRDIGVRDQIKYTDPNILVGGFLPPQLWGLNVLIPNTVYDTSNEGEASAMTDVWGKNAIVAYVDPSPSLNSLTLGAIFRARPWQVKQWRDDAVDANYYRPSVVQNEIFLSAACGYLMLSVIA